MSPAGGSNGQVKITLTLNGREVQAQPGQTILEVARAQGVDIPTLCYDTRLEAYGACRMCLVEVEGARGPMAACGTKVSEGMKVQTHTEKIAKLRKFVLELLLTNHPLDCPVCEAAGDCRLQDYAYEYLVDMVPWGWRPPSIDGPGDHPNVAHYGSRCILCGRCVRICREVMSIGCWGYLNRGYDSEVDTPYRLPLADVGCVSCGQCVSTCPVGAVAGQRSPLGARAWQTTKTATTCSYCADGCRLLVHSFRDRVVRVSSEEGKGLNGGNLCVKGRFALGYADAADRLTAPQVAQAGGGLQEAGWDEALKTAAGKIDAVRREHGGQAVAAVCGTNCTNEAAYLVQKLMRTVLGSNNVDSIDHPDLAASEKALTEAIGRGRGDQLALRPGGGRRHPGAGGQPHGVRPGTRADCHQSAEEESAGHRGRPAPDRTGRQGQVPPRAEAGYRPCRPSGDDEAHTRRQATGCRFRGRQDRGLRRLSRPRWPSSMSRPRPPSRASIPTSCGPLPWPSPRRARARSS